MFFGYIDPGTGYTIYNLGAGLLVFLLSFLGFVILFLKRFLRFFYKNKISFTFLLLAILVLIMLIYFLMNKKQDNFQQRLIILGFDGLSPEIIEPLMAQGKLPNFSKLKEIGTYSRLKTSNPSQSPVAWASIATGQNPGKTGLFDFIKRDPKTYQLNLAISEIGKNLKPKKSVKAKNFWEYLTKIKVPMVILHFPVTFPPDKISGKMLSGMGVPDVLGTEGTFTFYTSEPLKVTKDTGGQVFFVSDFEKEPLYLIGPEKQGIFGKVENVKVPFKVSFLKDRSGVLVEFQNKKTKLLLNSWSDWQEVTFSVGIFKKIKGIFKFYLVSLKPYFKLYISPINFDPRKPFFKISYPDNYAGELAEKVGLFHTAGMPIDTWAVNEGRLSDENLLEMAEEDFIEKKKLLETELKKFKKGVFFSYFGSSDTIQHMFWRFIDEKSPLHKKPVEQHFQEAIKNWYLKLDKLLGEVMSELTENDTIIVLSDHGFGPFRRAVNINTWLRKNGYLQLKNSSQLEGGELLKDIDWQKTRAYALGFGAIYLNLKGREGQGIVAPEEVQILKEEIIKKIKNWVDYEKNQKVVNNVYKNEEIFSGKYQSDAPDLYLGFNYGYRASWQTALGAVPEAILEDNFKKWSGDHLIDPALIPGVLFINKRIKVSSPSVYDIAPTILKIAGFEEEKIRKIGFDGQPLI